MLWPVNFTNRVHLQGDPLDDAHRTRNFDLCRAVDLTSLGVVLDNLVKAGMPKGQAELFKAQADALLQLMRTENNRLWADARKKMVST
jgi:hypothetical protein